MTDLTQYAQVLAEARDRHIAQAQGCVTDGAREYHVGYAAGVRHALALLHAWTDGEFGAATEDQPDPFEVPVTRH